MRFLAQFLLRLIYSVIGAVLGCISGGVISILYIMLFAGPRGRPADAEDGFGYTMLSLFFMLAGSIIGLICGVLCPIYLAKRRSQHSQQITPVAIEDPKVWPPPVQRKNED